MRFCCSRWDFFYDAFGRAAIVVIAAVLALVSTTFTPLVARDVDSPRSGEFDEPDRAVCIAMQLVIRRSRASLRDA
ncbi:MAG: hypothetical protein Udaeo2_11630 [Candidatus Udaeobacter sp.]|nr:MAG: hypothetical protein Udaeo2_11630 [Candidatus Udaeobacter sp.]